MNRRGDFKIPSPVDDRWRAILKYSRVPTVDDLYIVGSFARSVTVYSQQVRAIGLIDAMCGMGHLRQSTRVAVIGGGIAGLTAAAALVRIGVPVTLFEKEGTLIPLQHNSDKRYLHPHIYDWPLTGIQDVDARLPIMNWTAGSASHVAKTLITEWNGIKSTASAAVDSRATEVQLLQRSRKRWRVESSAVGTGESDNDRAVDEFDVVISCAGFGVEHGSGFAYPYWADLPLDDLGIHSQRWLVSGAGDGALTDLMRLCVRNFAQGDALRLVVETIERESGHFVDTLRARISEGVTGTTLFDGLPVKAIANALDLRKTPVTLNAGEQDVFGTSKKAARSSVLNRARRCSRLWPRPPARGTPIRRSPRCRSRRRSMDHEPSAGRSGRCATRPLQSSTPPGNCRASCCFLGYVPSSGAA